MAAEQVRLEVVVSVVVSEQVSLSCIMEPSNASPPSSSVILAHGARVNSNVAAAGTHDVVFDTVASGEFIAYCTAVDAVGHTASVADSAAVVVGALGAVQ